MGAAHMPQRFWPDVMGTFIYLQLYAIPST
jgi:hypothetical protein